jgi:hypothetical protein
MSSPLNSFLRYINRGKCEKLIKYRDRSFEFKGIAPELPGSMVRFGELTSEMTNIRSVVEIAVALDDFQYNLCNDLSNPLLKENLSKEELKKYIKALLGAQACILTLRNTLEAFKGDPAGQAENLNNSIRMMRNYLQSVTPDLTEKGLKAFTESLASLNLSEKDVDNAI